jgi:hypothetical protein
MLANAGMDKCYADDAHTVRERLSYGTGGINY